MVYQKVNTSCSNGRVIPQMQDWFKIQKSIKETHYINKFKRKDHMPSSADAKKKNIETRYNINLS